MTKTIEVLERSWAACGKTADDMRTAAVAVVASMCDFARGSGVSVFGREFASHMLVALGELENGRNSVLLKPARVPSNSFSAIDLAEQGTAFACVELLREAGISAADARAEISRYLEARGFSKFSTHKLRSLGTRLTGPGSHKDPAFEFYVIARDLIDAAVGKAIVGGKVHPDFARNLAKTLITTLRKRDHRLDSFPTPRPNSSNPP